MLKYIGKFVGFLLGLVLLLFGTMVLSSVNEPLNDFFAFISCSDEYERQDVETQTIIDATKVDNQYSKIIVGDSVCYLLFYGFQEQNDEYLFSGITRPATIATHYTMIKEFLENHPEADEVYMMLSYDTWRSIIDVQCGYSYFVVPNTIAGTMNNYDSKTIQEATEKFGTVLMNKSVVELYDKSLMNHKIVLNSLIWVHENVFDKDMSSSYELTEGMSDLAYDYFCKIEKLCEENNVELHLIHDPVADTPVKRFELECEKQMFIDMGLYDKYHTYFDNVLFYPIEMFFDGIHLNVEKELQSSVIKDIQEVTNSLEDIIIE